MNSKKTIMGLGLAAAMLAQPAAAQMSMPSLSSSYVGGSVGQSEIRFDCGAASCDRKGTAWRLFGGFQLYRNVAVEIAYSDLGNATFGPATVEANAWEVSAFGAVPVAARLSVYGKVGGYRGEVKANSPTLGMTGTATNTGWTWGFGGQFDFSRNIGARGEWQRYKQMGGGSLGSKADVDMMSVGLLWKFQ